MTEIALITPFTPSGELDLESLSRLAGNAVANGATRLLALTALGEAARLGVAEQREVLRTLREVAGPGGAQVVAHLTALTSRHAADLAAALAPHADVLVVAAPERHRAAITASAAAAAPGVAVTAAEALSGIDVSEIACVKGVLVGQGLIASARTRLPLTAAERLAPEAAAERVPT
ncbi:hypothetical protein GCM10022221_80010 [Actinocorallia aurea]